MRIVAFICAMLALSAVSSSAQDLVTFYEKSGYRETPRYAETIEYCRRLARSSPLIEYSVFGESPQGRDLPLLVMDADGNFEPGAIRRDDKAVLLIQACIHGGECDGKDAGLMLLRDIAADPGPFLEHVTVLFIPILNVDGHERFGPYNRINQNGPQEMGWRVNAQNLNLNRDYLKADTPEIQAWLRLFNTWQPDFFIDCHVTDGADYQYVLTYLMEIHGNMVPVLTRWTENVFLQDIEERMATAGYEMFPYVYLLDWPNPKGGLKSWVSTPRFSTGYTALRNRPGLLIETHMLKDYKTRVTATRLLLEQTIAVLGSEYESLKQANAEADAFAASDAFRDRLFALAFAPDERATNVDFKGIDFDVEESELTGGPWYRFNGKPVTFPVTYLGEQVPTVEVDLPEAYIIPPEWSTVIERLELHGVKLKRIDAPATLTVDSYRFRDVTWQLEPYEGRHPVSFVSDEIREERVFPTGSVVVDMRQPLAAVAAQLLEPDGPDSYVYWGFFDTIFEQKEFAESYVMERMAREMLAADEALRGEFEAKKQSDPDFASDANAMLNWFYMRTPYWDDQKNVYPVGKIFSEDVLQTIVE